MRKIVCLIMLLPCFAGAHVYTRAEVAEIYHRCQRYIRSSPKAQAALSRQWGRTVAVDRRACTEITRRSLAEDQRQMVDRRGRGGSGGLIERPSIGDTDREGKGSGPITCSGGKCSSYGPGQQPDLDCGAATPGSSNWCRTSSGSPTNIRCDTDSSGHTSCH